MRKNDYTEENIALASLLELRPGEVALDAQTEPDILLPLLHNDVTERGRTVGMSFGQETRDAVEAQLAKWELEEIQVVPAHPIRTPFKNELFHGIVLRHNQYLPDMDQVLKEAWRIAKPGARIVGRHMEWYVKLPHPTDEETEMLDTLQPNCCNNGVEFFDKFKEFQPKAWREVRMDVFSIANRDPRANTRFGYDWRTMLRDHLNKEKIYSPRQILDLIERLEDTRGAKVIVDRYLIVGIKT